jgi:hypothetical protein
VADLLRGDEVQSDCGKVILPFTALRRLDCVLQLSQEVVLAEKTPRRPGSGPDAMPAAGGGAELLQCLSPLPQSVDGGPGKHR